MKPVKMRTAPLESRYERKPALVPPYPVPMGTECRVRTGDSWRSVARAAKVPVWELIRFNCRTVDPAEVNWWLHNVVGCDSCTTDERNWAFSDASKPIYLPPPRSLKMPSDALAETVEFSLFEGTVQIGVLTLEGLCSGDAHPLSGGGGRYQQIVPPSSVSKLVWRSGVRMGHWSYGLLPDGCLDRLLYGNEFGYTVGSSNYLTGLSYPLYAAKVDGKTGRFGVLTNVTQTNVAEEKQYESDLKYHEILKDDPVLGKLAPMPRKVEPRYNYEYAFFTWKAKVVGWAASPPPGFILPD